MKITQKKGEAPLMWFGHLALGTAFRLSGGEICVKAYLYETGVAVAVNLSSGYAYTLPSNHSVLAVEAEVVIS